MQFHSPLVPATLVRRYKRFLADVIFDDGDMVTAHVANTGAMTRLDRPFSRVWLSKSADDRRKLVFNWELVEADLGGGVELVGVNTQMTNNLVAEALDRQMLLELSGYESVRREVKYGSGSRIDFLLESRGEPACYVEVKNVTLMRRKGHAEFPDCATERGTRHLNELAGAAAGGARAVLLFVIQIGSAESFSVARDIDPAYAEAFDRARKRGIEVLARRCLVSRDGVELDGPVPILG